MINRDVLDYFDDVPEGRKEKILAIHSLIVELYPKATIDMGYKMPTYHFGEGWVAIANQKNYISVYTCGYHHIESFKTKHPNIKSGKGCLNFRDKDKIPLTDLKPVIQHAMEHPKPE